jgi:rifampin ADP-ribosylating transferase
VAVTDWLIGKSGLAPRDADASRVSSTPPGRNYREYNPEVGANQAVTRVKLSTGVTLAFMEQGDRSGTPVLLLHAWAESLRCFDRLAPLLPPSLRVFTLDQRGHGDADKPPDGYDLDTLATDVVAFLDAVGLSSVVLAGSSSGGYVAQQVAVSHPDRVAGLVLIGSPRSLNSRPPFADEIEQLADPVDPIWVRQFLTWFPLWHDVPAWYIEDRVREAVRIPANVWQASFAGLISSPSPTEVGTISTPTLMLWGDRDQLLARDDQLALAAAIPNSKLVVCEGTGHLLLWEQPEFVAAHITRFVGRPALWARPGSRP